MNRTAAKLSGFALALAALGGGAFALGDTIDPVVAESSDGEHAEPVQGDIQDEKPDVPGGLQVSEHGYSLELIAAPAVAGTQHRLEFRVVGPDGAAVTDYERTHDKDLHLIVVRRDLSGFQHVHPTMADDGTWSIPITFPAAGTYRMFADFQATGAEGGVTLGADIQVAGKFAPVPLPDPARVDRVDGYEVTLDGALTPGTTSKLTLTVTKDGEPVTDLEPFLGAYGHLVALRRGDLAYLHVHPDGEPGDGRTNAGPHIVFYAEVPSTGDYRLFLDFAHDGVVRTAEFTATASGAAPDQDEESGGGHDDQGAGH